MAREAGADPASRPVGAGMKKGQVHGRASSAYRLLEWLHRNGIQQREVILAFLRRSEGGGLTDSSAKVVLANMISSGLLQAGWGLMADGRTHLDDRQRLGQTQSVRFVLLSFLDEEGFATLDEIDEATKGHRNVSAVLSWMKSQNLIMNGLIEMTEEGVKALDQIRKPKE
jgi:hypothetical protein